MEESTLCWKCQNAVPNKGKGCSWSRRFEPVEGWKAEKRYFKLFYGEKTETYRVIECPQFVSDPPKPQPFKREIKPKPSKKIPGAVWIMTAEYIERDVYSVDGKFIVYKNGSIKGVFRGFGAALACSQDYPKQQGVLKRVFKIDDNYYTIPQVCEMGEMAAETIKSKLRKKQYNLLFEDFRGVIEN